MKLVLANMWLFRPILAKVSPMIGGEVNALMRTTCAITMMEGSKTFAGGARWLKERAHKKSDTYYKYEMLGLFILVAIPLPGTGAWTGALVASVMGLKMKRAIPPIFLGVAAAGIIMLTLSLGVVSVFN